MKIKLSLYTTWRHTEGVEVSTTHLNIDTRWGGELNGVNICPQHAFGHSAEFNAEVHKSQAQVAAEIKLCVCVCVCVMPIFVYAQYGPYSKSPFSHLEAWDGSKIFVKFVHPRFNGHHVCLLTNTLQQSPW